MPVNGSSKIWPADLFPDGSLFLYAAGKWNPRTERDDVVGDKWTAISKPPDFTALALWPIHDLFSGGGSFPDNTTLYLSHLPGSRETTPYQPLVGLTIVEDHKDGFHVDRLPDRIRGVGWRLFHQG